MGKVIAAKLQTIIELMTNCPVIGTEHVARYFSDRGSPGKRASEHMHHLQHEKLVESYQRPMGKTKVWRLSKKARALHGITARPVALNSNKVEHYLAIANLYMDLRRKYEVKKWMVELREECGKFTYCPDAFAVIKTDKGAYAYLFEVQKSPLSQVKWAEKWTIASTFLDNPEYVKAASFQYLEGRIIRPRIVVISSQQIETIQAESRLPLIIAKDIKAAALI